MALETASYISQLNVANPAEGDPVNQGSDHLRLVKSVLQTTFPNLNAPVGFNPEKLTNGALPVGSIILWSGAALPTGWALCDGGTYAKMDGSGNITTPNLSGLFVQAGPLASIGQTGGASSATPSVAVAGTSLTADQLAAHTHSVNDPGHSHGAYQDAHTHNATPASVMQEGGPASTFHGGGSIPNHNTAVGVDTQQPGVHIYGATTGISLQNTGSGNPHTHSATASSVSTVPPFVVLAYIYKL